MHFLLVPHALPWRRARLSGSCRPLLLCLCLLLPSCMATGTKVTTDQLTQFTRGTTTYADVVAALGKPTSMTLAADGSRHVTYLYSQNQMKWETFVPIVAMFSQGATAETTTVTLDFAPTGVLVSYTASEGQTQMGTGFSSGAKQ